MSVKLNSTGGGSVTLDSPSTASNYTVTLPSAAGTLATTTGTGSVFTNPTINGFTGDTSAITIGTTQFVKDTSGNVGIGTSSPAGNLQVQNGASGSTSVIIGNGAVGASSTITINGGNTVAFGPVIFGAAASSNEWLICSLRGAAGAGAGVGGMADYVYGAYPRVFYTNGVERARIDGSGNLGLGVTPSAWSNYKAFQFGYTGAISNHVSLNYLRLESNSYNGSSGDTFIQNGYATKYIQNNNSGIHAWYTSVTSGTAGAAFTPTQAMTLDASGNLLVGGTNVGGRVTVYPATTPTTTAGANQIWIGEATQNINYRLQLGYGLYGGAYKGTIQSYAGGSPSDLVLCAAGGSLTVGATSVNPVGDRTNGLVLQQTGILVRGISGSSYFGLNATSGVHIVFYTDNGSAYVTAGNISSSSGTTLYNATSDQRLKENIVDAPNALSSINAIKVRSFDWKADGSHSEYGYIAQELLEVAPEAVHVPVDPEEMMGVDFGKLTPRLVKAIQELSAQNNALEARLAQLEAK